MNGIGRAGGQPAAAISSNQRLSAAINGDGHGVQVGLRRRAMADAAAAIGTAADAATGVANTRSRASCRSSATQVTVGPAWSAWRQTLANLRIQKIFSLQIQRI
ncbi:MAG: hypothetical protein H7242_19210 [Microbacteriaceae bacterium]|nr:hypothetical protein [Burkholderiaceae bacterium]